MKHNLKRVIATGWTNFKRNSYISFAVTGVMALVLILLLGLASFQLVSSRLIGTIEGKVDISAYFKPEASEEHALSVRADLEKLPEVAGVSYLSREQVLEDFKKNHADEPATLDALSLLDDNPFGAALNIRAKDPTEYEGIATFLENSTYRSSIKEISYNDNKAVIDKITRFSGALRTWGLITALIIAVIAVLITFNTIRLTIYNQRQEIEIMRLVGASNWHIQGPYLAEGGFYGAFATLIALVVFYPVLYFISNRLHSFIPEVDMFRYFLVNSWQIVLLTLFAGLLLGMLSSIIAIRKHLKI